MQTPKIREKLLNPPAPVIFGKIKATLQSMRALPMGSEHAESVSAYGSTEEYHAYQLEVERLKAMAEGYAQRLRRRLI